MVKVSDFEIKFWKDWLYADTLKRQDMVRVVGQTEKEAVIEIFGERIYQNEHGVFNYDFPLELGENKLVIEVEGANGRKTTISEIYILKE